MIRALLPFLALPGLVGAQAPEVPSGTKVELFEVLLDTVEGEDWARFRFLAPALAGAPEDAPDYFVLVNDFPHLCVTIALPYLTEYELTPQKISISLSGEKSEFGAANPDVTQFFELFTIQDGTCIWEAF